MLPSDILRQQIGKANAQYYRNVVLGNPTRTVSAANPQTANFMASRFTGEQEGNVRRFYVSDLGMSVEENCCGATTINNPDVYVSIANSIVVDPTNTYLYTIALTLKGPAAELEYLINGGLIESDPALVLRYLYAQAVYRVPVNSSSTTTWTKVVDLPSNYLCDYDAYVNSIVFSPDGKLYFTAISSVTRAAEVFVVQNLSGTPLIVDTGLDTYGLLTPSDQVRDFIYFNGYLVITINSGTGPMSINNIYMYKISATTWSALLPNPPVSNPFDFMPPFGQLLANSNNLYVGGAGFIYLFQDSNTKLAEISNDQNINRFAYDTYNSNVYGVSIYIEDLAATGFRVYKYQTSASSSNFSNLQSVLTPVSSNETFVAMNVVNNNFYILTDSNFYNSNSGSTSWYSNNPPPKQDILLNYSLSDMFNLSNGSSNYLIILNNGYLSPSMLNTNEVMRYNINTPTVPATYTRIGANFT